MMRETEFAPTTHDTSSNNINHGNSLHTHQYSSEIGAPSLPMEQESWEVPDARPLLPSAAFFMGDLRDGLPMLNMQAAFLISEKDFSKKEVGILFFVFGMSQFLCMAPAGYLMDYSSRKIDWVIGSGFITSLLTVVTVLTAGQAGEKMRLMILWKVLQGGATSVLPPGFNGITLGIVGSTGFTHQVSRNRMMNHIGTALVVAIGSLIAYCLYPNIGALFMVSPLAAFGMYYNLVRIKPNHVNKDAARGLIIESPTMNEYEQMDESVSVQQSASIWQSMDECDDENEHNRSSNVEGGQRLDGEFRYQRQSQNKVNTGYVPPDTRSELWKPASSGPAFETTHFSTGRTDPSQRPPSSNVIAAMHTPSGLPPTIDERNRIDPMRHNMERVSTQDSKVPGYASEASFNLGWGGSDLGDTHDHTPRMRDNANKEVDANIELVTEEGKPRRARTPRSVLLDPVFVTFTFVVFFFHLANSSVLPLVMQSLALEDAQGGILLSGLCIIIAQGFMSFFAKLCGDYSPKWGRKKIMVAGLAALTLRCFLLTFLFTTLEKVETKQETHFIKVLILATQLLDSMGAGIFGTLYILVTNDISGVSGRFSLLLGVTTGAVCLGGTVSGYIGQAIAQDYGYHRAFGFLGVMSLIPLFLYVVFMPETLPDYVKPKNRRRRLAALLKRLNEHRRKLSLTANPFRTGHLVGLGEIGGTVGMMHERLQAPAFDRMTSSPSQRSLSSPSKVPAATAALV